MIDLKNELHVWNLWNRNPHEHVGELVLALAHTWIYARRMGEAYFMALDYSSIDGELFDEGTTISANRKVLAKGKEGDYLVFTTTGAVCCETIRRGEGLRLWVKDMGKGGCEDSRPSGGVQENGQANLPTKAKRATKNNSGSTEGRKNTSNGSGDSRSLFCNNQA